jgi:hypothetical protein
MKTYITAKPISLTKEQQDRLIEMSTELFPDREWEMKGYKIHHEETELEEKEYLEFSMHWMEFLLYKLIPTFSKRFGPITLTWNMKNFQKESINMIDEFYEKYFKPFYDEN